MRVYKDDLQKREREWERVREEAWSKQIPNHEDNPRSTEGKEFPGPPSQKQMSVYGIILGSSSDGVEREEGPIV